jgi:hypothetical protein
MRSALLLPLIFVLAQASAAAAVAQPRCTEGRTAAGDCVDARLAAAQRKHAIVQTQQKVSCISAPVLPVEDRDYPLLREHRSVLQVITPGRDIFLAPRGC